jgi:hypothetical protein
MTKPLTRQDGMLQITTRIRSGRTDFHWHISNADLLGVPAVVQKLFLLDLCDRLHHRPGVISIRRHGGSVTGVHAEDAPMIEAVLRRWLRRILAWPGAGKFAQAPSEVSLLGRMPAPEPGDSSVPLSHIERLVEKLYRMDAGLRFSLLEVLPEPRSSTLLHLAIEALKPLGLTDREAGELIVRFGPSAVDDPLTEITKRGQRTRPQVLGNVAPRLPAIPSQGLPNGVSPVLPSSGNGRTGKVG